jgi:hypothetical protein
VQTVALTWQQATEVGAVLAATGLALRLSGRAVPRKVAPFVLEACVIAVLYGIWQRAGELSVVGGSGALRRSHWIARTEHDWHLPSERTVQNLILGHPLAVQAANLYYATMHFTMLFAFLIWLFVRHRDRYRPVRSILALTTASCLVIQFLPVAPPRMLPGYVDTAGLYDQSVYGTGFAPDQLSAMPSVHVAWAVLIGWYVARVSSSRWRWIGVLHATLTVVVVVATANHWWLDGIVAVAVLAICAWLWHGCTAVWRSLRRQLQPAAATQATPERVPG